MEIRLGFSAVSRHCYFGVLGSEIKGGTLAFLFQLHEHVQQKPANSRRKKPVVVIRFRDLSLSLFLSP